MKTLSINVGDYLYKGIVKYLQDTEQIPEPTQKDVELYIAQFLDEEEKATGAWTWFPDSHKKEIIPERRKKKEYYLDTTEVEEDEDDEDFTDPAGGSGLASHE